MGKTRHGHRHFEDDVDEEDFELKNKRNEDIQRRSRKGTKLKSWYVEATKREDEGTRE